MTDIIHMLSLISARPALCTGLLLAPMLLCCNWLAARRLTPVERRLIWENGPGQELQENSATLGMLGMSVAVFMLSMSNPGMQLVYTLCS